MKKAKYRILSTSGRYSYVVQKRVVCFWVDEYRTDYISQAERYIKGQVLPRMYDASGERM